MSKVRAWIHAARLRTLPLAASSVLTGSAWAAMHGHMQWSIWALALVTAWCLQVLSNLANDYGDYHHGTDNAQRVGPARAMQAGMISAGAMKRGIALCAIASLCSGSALLYVSLAVYGMWLQALVLFAIGLAAIRAAYRYTAGTKPYGYSGWGDVSVFLFFGAVAVAGTAFLHLHQWHWTALLPAAANGLLATAVLHLNNMRDAINDEACGKCTMAVRMGPEISRIYHAVLIIGGIVLFIVSFFPLFIFQWWWLVLLIVPVRLLVKHLMFVMKTTTTPAMLDEELKKVALATFFFALVLFVAAIWR